MKQMVEAGDDSLTQKWFEQYGRTIVTTGLFNVWKFGTGQADPETEYQYYLQKSRLHTMDTTAIHYILMNSTTIFQRSHTSRINITRLLGPGLLVTEGEEHKLQVRDFSL